MNSTFKVVFNKARGALMVVNEVTSSVQAKGTKTVVATAVAAMIAGVAGTAVAAETEATPAPKKETITVTTENAAEKLKDGTVFDGYKSVTGSEFGAIQIIGTDLNGEDNQTVYKNLVFKNNVAAKAGENENAGQGGAIYMNGGALSLVDATFEGNKAAGWGGAIRMRADNADSGASLFLKYTDDATIFGNQAKQAEGYDVYGDMGGFAHLGGFSTLDLTVAADKTLTIGVAGAADKTVDSIASTGEGNLINVAGNVVVNSSTEAYVGDIDVKSGKLTLATGFGSIDNWAPVKVATLSESATLEPKAVSKLTVQSGAEAVVGDLTINRTAKDGEAKAGTVLDVKNGGKLTVNSINVTDSKYTKPVVAAAAATTTTPIVGKMNGWGQIEVEASGVATVTEGLTVGNDAKFDKLGAGKLTVGALNIAAAIKDDATTTEVNEARAAGVLNLVGELAVKGNSKNGGSIVVATSDTTALTIAGGTFENTGNIGAIDVNKRVDKVTVTEGATLTNTGIINADQIIIEGTVNTDVLVKTSGALTGHLWYQSAVLGENGVMNLVKLGDDYKAGLFTEINGFSGFIPAADAAAGATAFDKTNTLYFKDAAITLKGGELQLGGKKFTGSIIAAADDDDKIVVDLQAGDYVLEKVGLKNGKFEQNGGTFATNAYYMMDGKVNLNKGTTSIGELNVQSGAFTVGNTTTVTGELVNTAGTVSVALGGVLNVTAAGIDLAIDEDDLTAVWQEKATVAADFTGVTNKGTVNVTGLEGKEIVADFLGASGIASKIAGSGVTNVKGVKLVKLGESGATTSLITDGVAKFDEVKVALENGITTDDLAAAKVTGVDTTAIAGSVGSVELKVGQTTLNVKNGATLQLNGTGTLVTVKDAAATAALPTVTLASDSVVEKTSDGAATIGGLAGGEGTFNAKAGSLEINGAVDIKNLNVDGSVTMGTSGSGEDATVYELKANKIAVEGALTALGDVTLASGGTVVGTANLGDLTVTAGSLDVTGVANVENLVAGLIKVGNDKAAGSAVIAKMTGGTVFADPAWENGLPSSRVVIEDLVEGQVEAGLNSKIAVGTDNIADLESALARTNYKVAEAADGEQNVDSVVYVAGRLVTTGTGAAAVTDYQTYAGKIAATSNTSATASSNLIGANSMMIVDLNKVDTTANAAGKYTALLGSTLTVESDTNNRGILYLVNATDSLTFNLDDNNAAVANALFNGDRIMKATAATDGKSATIAVDETENGLVDQLENAGFALSDVVVDLYKNNANNGTSKSARFNDWLMSTSNGYSNSEVAEIAEAIAVVGATSGLANVTMDAVSEFNRSVGARTSILAQRGEGVNVWVDVNGGKFEGKKVVDGEVGYSSDIFAGVLGADVTVACGATVGAALTVGTADTDSKGKTDEMTADTSIDTDYVGVSVYANKPIGEVANVAFDLGYVKASNELTVKNFGLGTVDADTDAFTFGVRGELLAKVGSVDVVPHVGLRWTRLSFDQFETGYVTDIDSMNIFQMPVGVTFAANVDVEGWNIAPKFDLTFTPTWGDKDIEQKIGITGSSVKAEVDGIRVLDNNVVNATLGVAAQNGAWTFGLDYKLGVGSDDRLNNSFNARVNYAF